MENDKKISLLTIGDELLLGESSNRHLTFVGNLLFNKGLRLSRNIVVDDSKAAIKQAVMGCLEDTDILLTTGGLGPTADDNTREAIAEILELELEQDPAIKAHIEKRFQKRNVSFNSGVLKQCMRPQGAKVFHNEHGTAPGLLLKHSNKIIVMLPGPPEELRPMLTEQVFPDLEHQGHMPTEICDTLKLNVFGLAESQVNQMVEGIIKEYPQVQSIYNTSNGLVKVTLRCPHEEQEKNYLASIGSRCRELFGDNFIGLNNESLAQVVFNEVRAMEKTLSIAESCTGGLLSNAFTNIPGASKVLKGGLVCYTNETKIEVLGVPESIIQQHGAVSAETALAMATGAAETFSTSYALSITGFAGPGGGTPANPIGTIFIGFHSPSGAWTQKIVHLGDREVVKAKAVNEALDFMRRKVMEYKKNDMLATV